MENKAKILLEQYERDGDYPKLKSELLLLYSVGRSLPHESQIDDAIDKLLVIRGEHPSRVRNPLYGEERQLAKDTIKYMLLQQ